MKKIPLGRGLFALVDDVNFNRLNKYKWHAHKGKYDSTYYAVRNGKYKNGKRDPEIKMHREILKLHEADKLVDHIDHDGLNNQKFNLRKCTPSQNQHNRKKQSGTSRFKGVSFHKRDKCWQSNIQVNGMQIFLGYFKSEQSAALAHYKAAVKFHGNFAHH